MPSKRLLCSGVALSHCRTLGTYQDELAALQAWQTLSGHEPRALFGAGWLSARREPHVLACQQACDRLARKAQPFWD